MLAVAMYVTASAGRERMKRWMDVEHLMEILLWRGRLIMLIPVVGSALLALAAIFVATAEDLSTLGKSIAYLTESLGGHSATDPSTLIAAIIKSFDAYLVAAILLIFTFGLYELFISKINAAEDTEHGSRLLVVRDLDDLKNRLGKTVLLILIIEALQQALQHTYPTPAELLMLGGLILLIGVALWLSNLGGH